VARSPSLWSDETVLFCLSSRDQRGQSPPLQIGLHRQEQLDGLRDTRVGQAVQHVGPLATGEDQP